jgi:hypothetical protein
VKRPEIALLSALAAILAAAALALWFSSPSTERSAAPTAVPTRPAPSQASASHSPRPPATPREPETAAVGASPLAVELNAPSGTGQRDLEVLQTLLRQYFRRLRQRQGLPIGDDIDLARALSGQNPMRVALIPQNHPAISADGHLRDRWGSPYFIHPKGHSVFEIRSAGPDRKLFTDDDIVADPMQSDAEPGSP